MFRIKMPFQNGRQGGDRRSADVIYQPTTLAIPARDVLDEDENTLWESNNPFSENYQPSYGSAPGGRARRESAGSNISENDFNVEEGCGYWSWRPLILKNFATRQAFAAVYCFISIMQGMFYTYFASIITTLEKRFAISSRTLGIVMSGNECSQIIFSLLLTYYGGQSHRPRLIGAGLMITAISCVVMAAPELFPSHNTAVGPAANVWAQNVTEQDNQTHMVYHNSDLCTANKTTHQPDCDTTISDTIVPAMVLLFFGQFLSGIGSTALHSFSMTFLDDNVKKTKTGLYFGFTSGIRMLGPALGYILGAYCLNKYVDPSVDPGITRKDPRWIGAWWLGFFIIALGLSLGSVLTCAFPKELKKTKSMKIKNKMKPTAKDINRLSSTEPRMFRKLDKEPFVSTATEGELPKLKDFPRAVKNLLTNKVLFYHTCAVCCGLFGAIGYFTFVPKYFEAQFHQTAASASLFAGVTGVAVQMVGMMGCGVVIHLFKPSARIILMWSVFVKFVHVIGMLLLMAFYCTQPMMAAKENSHGLYDVETACSDDCGCSELKFSPVCVGGEITYFSPCHAGCSITNASSTTTKTNQMFSSCQCAVDDYPFLINMSLSNLNASLSNHQLEESATDAVSGFSGFCSVYCYQFTSYIILMTFLKILSSTTNVGGMMVTIRCVKAGEKSMAIGLLIFFLSIFTFIPTPIVYGAIVDSTCKIWETNCDKTGNCWMYDSDQLRIRLHLITAVFMFMAMCFETLVWIHGKDVNLYDDVVSPNGNMLKSTKVAPISTNSNQPSYISMAPVTT